MKSRGIKIFIFLCVPRFGILTNVTCANLRNITLDVYKIAQNDCATHCNN